MIQDKKQLIAEMYSLEAKIKELDLELDHYLVDLVEQRLEYIYKRIASNTK